MTRLLLDPLILVPLRTRPEDEEGLASFVERLTLWATDERATIGSATHSEVCAHYAEKGYPDAPLPDGDVPRYLQREYSRSLNRLLSRIAACAKPSIQHVPSPDYLGPSALCRALIDDLAGYSDAVTLGGLATDASHWDPVSTRIRLTPGPPAVLDFCSTPGAKLEAESQGTIRTFYASRRLHVVGGRPREAVPDALAEALGIAASTVTWMPAEKGKPPRNIRSRWAQLDPSRDVTACLTGCIGHSESSVAARAAAARGVPHVKGETVPDLVGALEELALHG